MKTQKHTQTPWMVNGYTIEEKREPSACIARVYSDPEDDCGVSEIEGKANAAFIVRAVNSHEELVHTLRWVEDKVNRIGEFGMVEAIRTRLQQAIAKAEGL